MTWELSLQSAKISVFGWHVSVYKHENNKEQTYGVKKFVRLRGKINCNIVLPSRYAFYRPA